MNNLRLIGLVLVIASFFVLMTVRSRGDLLDVSTVVGFQVTDTGILLHTEDGGGYYIEAKRLQS